MAVSENPPSSAPSVENLPDLSNSEPETTINDDSKELDTIDSKEQEEMAKQETQRTQRTLDENGDEYLSGWKLISVMLAITFAAFLMLLDMSILSTAIPQITTHFHSLDDIGWYAAAYNLASSALQPLSGKMYTYFKTKWLFLGFFSIFELGCLICALAPSSKVLIIGRAVSGIGTSGIQNGAFTMIAVITPIHRRPMLTGLLMGISMMGIVSGPLVGGALTEYTTWRWCFWINLPIGAVCAVCLLFVQIPDKTVKTGQPAWHTILHKFDLSGFAIFAPCTIMFLLALQWGGDKYPWDSATIIGLFCGAGGALAVFIYREYKAGDDAMIPFSMIGKRQIWASCTVGLCLMAVVITSSYYLPIYFQSVKSRTPFQSGVDMLPAIVSQLFAAILSGALAQRVGYYLPFAVLSAVLAIVSNALISTLTPTASTVRWAGYLVLLGLGRGMGMQMPLLGVQFNTSPDKIAVVNALLVFCQTFTGAVSMSIANVVFTSVLRKELKSRLPGANTAKIVAAGATAVREVVPAKQLADAYWSYAKGVSGTFYLLVAFSAIMFFAAWGMGWNDVRKKEPAAAGDA